MHGGAFQSPDTALVGDGVCIWPGWYPGLSYMYQIPGCWHVRAGGHLGITKSNVARCREGMTEIQRGDKICRLVAELGTRL